MYTKIKTGTIEEKKLQCVFLLIYCVNGVPYDKYNLPNGPNEIPVLLSLGRHDGYEGFIGGKVEPGEMLLQGLYRETFEETGYRLDIMKVKELVTYSSDDANIHSFIYEVDYEELKNIAFSIMSADHFGIEITGFKFNHLTNYIHEGGIDQTLKQNWKATAKMELEEFLLQTGFANDYR